MWLFTERNCPKAAERGLICSTNELIYNVEFGMIKISKNLAQNRIHLYTELSIYGTTRTFHLIIFWMWEHLKSNLFRVYPYNDSHPNWLTIKSEIYQIIFHLYQNSAFPSISPNKTQHDLFHISILSYMTEFIKLTSNTYWSRSWSQ